MSKRNERKLKDLVADLRDTIKCMQQREDSSNEEYGRYSDALEELMRDVMRDLCDRMNHPTSIASARMLEAVLKASRTVHSRRETTR